MLEVKRSEQMMGMKNVEALWYFRIHETNAGGARTRKPLDIKEESVYGCLNVHRPSGALGKVLISRKPGQSASAMLMNRHEYQ